MQERFSGLKCKEIINICDGCRLGYASDLELELPSGRIAALIVPGPSRFFGLLGRVCDYCIPWPCVKRVGEDIILVDVILDQVRLPKIKKSWFSCK